MLRLVVVVWCAVVTVQSAAVQNADDIQLPVGTITCQIDSPHINECIKEAVNDMIPKLNDGMPNLNIPALDPFVRDRTAFKFKRPDLFDVAGEVRNLRVIGGSKAVLKSVKSNITRDDLVTDITLTIPEVYAEGLYKNEGRFNNIRIKSKGYFNVTARDITMRTQQIGRFETINGNRHLRLTHFNLYPTIGDMKFFATGILPDPELNRLVLDFINQYWPYVYREALPQSRDIWEPIAVAEANKFLLTVPIKKILYFSDEV